MAEAEGTADQRAQLSRLVLDGKHLESIFQGIAHGNPVAPPPISGVSGWFQDAARVARAFEAIAADPPAERKPG
jgi:hypothetical protein